MNPDLPRKPGLMAHLIPCYPDYESSLAAAGRIIEAGASFLELQFPFSDPSADGPVIQTACTHALAQGFTVEKGFQFIADLSAAIPLYVMTYANIIFTQGIPRFVRRCRDLGVAGLIVPDLPPDSDEGLNEECEKAGITNVAVTLTGTPEGRLALIRRRRLIYVSLRSGITGRYTELRDQGWEFLQGLRSETTQTIAGFGIRGGEQIRRLAGHTDIVVVGSAIVEKLRDFGPRSPELGDFLDELLKECAPPKG